MNLGEHEATVAYYVEVKVFDRINLQNKSTLGLIRKRSELST